MALDKDTSGNGQEKSQNPSPEDLLAGASIANTSSLNLRLIKEFDSERYKFLLEFFLTDLCINVKDEAAKALHKEARTDRLHFIDSNQPAQITSATFPEERLLKIIRNAYSEEKIRELIELGTREFRSSIVMDIFSHGRPCLIRDLSKALEKFRAAGATELTAAHQETLKVRLLRQFFNLTPKLLNRVAQYVDLNLLLDLRTKMIGGPESIGQVGGKHAGAFLAFSVLQKIGFSAPPFGKPHIPNTLNLTMDAFPDFSSQSGIQLASHRRQDLEKVSHQYPDIILMHKDGEFPESIRTALLARLIDLVGKPTIARSSSDLEDRAGTAFAGKYKSLFLANQGSLAESLEAHLGAIAEIYASVYSPDAIHYRQAHDLINEEEAMAIMIQEVVGSKITTKSGRNFFGPILAGVAYSHNEYPWSNRLDEKDGLIRSIFGLGTGAVDRGSDHAHLVSAGKPSIKPYAKVRDQIRYSQHSIQLVDLDRGVLSTLDLAEFLADADLPDAVIQAVFSRHEMDGSSDGILKPVNPMLGFDPKSMVVTLDGMIKNGFADYIHSMLRALEERFGHEIDLEWAISYDSAAKSWLFHVLQCRPHHVPEHKAEPRFPSLIKDERVLFSTRGIDGKGIQTNGFVPNIQCIVYTDPEGYRSLPSENAMRLIEKAAEQVNKTIKDRGVVSIHAGAGRYGSEGDIYSGPPIKYSGLSNSEALVEISCPSRGYTSELSYGCHFFGDLSDGEIIYLPVDAEGDYDYPFYWDFFKSAKNHLAEFAPGYEILEGALKVIDVSAETGGKLYAHLYSSRTAGRAMVILEPFKDAETIKNTILSKEVGNF